ncbi:MULTISPECIES: hypothetical protein [Yersinia]|uniref:Uncharacterized protein n=1 Tax=Yersinia proxima TaxID=2890316 RepID=A0ABW9EWE9_9GAMM|nr:MULTISPECIES: hypothetical protein [Yersinia]EEP97135.1 hypothetical protein yaldo0001_11270 [Yersinia aldovae ATCC 35236]UYJ98749.1 hypothetical protein N4W06_06770 [Yersinia enterocolitica]
MTDQNVNLPEPLNLCPIAFKLQEGGKGVNPDVLTQVSDSGD